ncbi:MAG: 1-(5-phosphoribosyl)-5-[(5-phosphoribosylamino)methylideneamino]imidazole-4-carboxamide isomerase [Verrucomicrobia bacterium]|nr:1-(5-phosphoribosyl)-5-[(5-phosphoribosylamino)methylideneamino]imidazole-4-carboxamide isomerase [Verrucomicrobiota bacterium]
MLLLPAIDLMHGQAVRLRQGRAEEKTVFSDDPVAVAQRWANEGGDWVHLVDLDAAFSGRAGMNLETVRAICAAVPVPCELGGGLRDEAAVRAALDAGVARVVIGTRAAEAMGFVAGLVQAFGQDHVAVGIDAKHGLVATKGWTESTPRAALDVAREAEAAGVGAIIYTDIATDGMMQGPNFSALDELLAAVNCDIIASGGVTTAGDVRALAQRPRLHGAIIGRALYEGTLTLRAARNALG